MKWIVRASLAVMALVLIAFTATYFLSAEPFRASIQRGLERTLQRPVQIKGETRFVLFPHPGFSVDDVVIDEDPSFSVEPFVYVSTLKLGLSLIPLATGRFEVNSIQLIEPSINLMKKPDGGWNFQLFLEQALKRKHTLPAIEVTTGRINFKFGDLKNVFYLADTDLTLDANSSAPDQFGIRFEGEPARTDRATRAFGRLSGRGMLDWKPAEGAQSRLTLSLALERSAIAEFATLFESRPFGLTGFISSRARVSGPMSDLAIEGRLQLDEVERFSWLLPSSTGWALDYRGSLDLVNQRFTVETAPTQRGPLPVSIRLRAQDILSRARWAALFTLRDLPVDSLRALLSEMAPAIASTNLPVTGRLSGALSFTPAGLLGLLQSDEARLLLEGPVLSFRSEDLEARIDTATGARDVRYRAKETPLDSLRKLTYLTLPPALDMFRSGVVSGPVRAQTDGSASTTAFELSLQDGQAPIAGIAGPVEIQSAILSGRGAGFSARDIHGRIGKLPFTATYTRSKLSITMPQATLPELEQALAPTLRRSSSLFSRTLGRAQPVPEWLQTRKLSGAVTIASLTIADQVIPNVQLAFTWEGPRLLITSIESPFSDGKLTGSIAIVLNAPQPDYRGDFLLRDAGWHGARIDIDARLRAQGSGLDFVSSLALDGAFSARDLDVPSDEPLRAVSGTFSYKPTRLELSALQANIGGTNYTGQGIAGPDRRLSLDLASPSRALKLTNLRIPFE